MRIVYIILGVLGCVIVLLLVIALFCKKDYAVERSVVINKPRNTVFNYIRYLKNQDNYSVWNQLDPAMKKTYSGTDGTPGFFYAWDSNNKDAGKGEQEIAGIKENERVDMKIHFIKPYEGRATAYMTTDEIASSETQVKWGILGHMKYPMNVTLLFMNMDKLMGPDLDKGLANLKTVLEK